MKQSEASESEVRYTIPRRSLDELVDRSGVTEPRNRSGSAEVHE